MLQTTAVRNPFARSRRSVSRRHAFPLFLLFVFALVTPAAAQDYRGAPELRRKFGDYLVKLREFERAAIEYDACLAMLPAEAAPDVVWSAARCRYLTRDYAAAERLYRRSRDLATDAAVADSALYHTGLCLYRQRLYGECAALLKTGRTTFTDSALAIHANRLLVVNQALAGDHGLALTSLGAAPQADDDRALGREIQRFARQRTANPLWSAALSTVLPGLGRLPSHRWKDGLYSLLVVGATAFATVNAYNHDGTESVRFWLYGSLGMYFYAGNVYGSAAAAKHYNHQARSAFEQTLETFVFEPRP